MAKRVNNNQNSNINNSNYNSNIRMVERPAKVYTYCWQCGSTLEPPSLNPFCCWEHQQEYYAEQRKEADACFNEWRGKE